VIVHRGEDPGPFSDPRAYVEYLRECFGRRCAYCRTPDDKMGGLEGMRVDHFVPESRAPELRVVWMNLYYCCDTCNNRKSNLPKPSELDQGLRFVDPCAEDPDHHFQLTPDPGKRDHWQVQSKNGSVPADYTIRKLQFNRRAHLREFWRELDATELEIRQRRQ